MASASQTVQPLHASARAAAMNLFPAMGSLREVTEWAESQLPITNKNDLVALLGRYHNTLLKQLSQ